MRQRYRNRPIFGLVFWTLLLGGSTLYTAWKFDWLSIDFSEVIGRRANPVESTGPAVGQSADDAPVEGATVDGAVFTEQTEPPVDLAGEESPESQPQEPETTARLRELQQRHTARDTSATNRIAVKPDFSARVPSSPFSDAPPATAPARSPGVNKSFLGDESPQSRIADFRPREQKRPDAAHAVTEMDARQLADRTMPVDRKKLSRDLQDAERVVQASNEEPQSASPPVTGAVAEALREVDRMLEGNDILGAHRELSKAYWSHPELRGVIRPRIEKTAETIYFSPQPHFLEPYIVQDGDQFAKFAKTYDVPWQYLAKLNRVDPTRIRAGQKLKVIRGPFSAVVELSRFELTVHAHGYYVRRFDVGVGKQGSSPVGKHTVLEKVANPQYTDPEGRVVEADDPSNPLGEHWIDLGDGYGIHGTIDPNSIGRAESRGCVRLRNEDVSEVYDLLGVGSEVVIRP